MVLVNKVGLSAGYFSGIIHDDTCPICGGKLKIQRIKGNVFSRCMACKALSTSYGNR